MRSLSDLQRGPKRREISVLPSSVPFRPASWLGICARSRPGSVGERKEREGHYHYLLRLECGISFEDDEDGGDDGDDVPCSSADVVVGIAII